MNLESSRLEFHAKKISPIVAFLRLSVTFLTPIVTFYRPIAAFIFNLWKSSL